MAMAPEQIGIGIRRHYTRAGDHPYDTVEWERQEARIPNYKDGGDAFFQPDVEFPVSWSQNATNIVAQKYFRGSLGTPEREDSLKQVVDRVADTIAAWGFTDGYFVDEQEAAAFRNELKYLLIHQHAAFNSPVWFNIGVNGVPQQASACQPYHAPVATPKGLVPIGQLVESTAVGKKVFDAHGLTKILAVKANGQKQVLRIHTKAGITLDVTPDHLVWRATCDPHRFVEAGTLRAGDELEWYGVEEFGASLVPTGRVVREPIENIESLGKMDVYDIQTESGEYLSNHLRVHNCFILAVDDTMNSILNWYREEGIIFKGGSGSGINVSTIRSSKEHLKGGGTASGPVSFMRGADASAGTIKCLHADTAIATDHGIVPIREAQPGWRVMTRMGLQPIDAVHDNGVRPLVRVRTSLGDEIVCTPEHRFRIRGRDGEQWREACDLRSDDHLMVDLWADFPGEPQPLVHPQVQHHREVAFDFPTFLNEPLSMWLGWIYGDGSVTSRPNAKFITMQIGDTDSDLVRRYMTLTRGVFGDKVHFYESRHVDKRDASTSVRFSSGQVIRFLELNGLRKAKTKDLRVPALVQSSSPAVRAAFLAGLFEADGHVGNGYPQFSTASPALARDVHRLLLSIGIPSVVSLINDRRTAYGDAPMHTVRVVAAEGVRRFAKLVGFLSDRKQWALEAALDRKNRSRFETKWFLPHVEHELNKVWENTSDQRLRRAVAPYCRYQHPRRLSLLRARALCVHFPEELSATSLPFFVDGDTIFVTASVEPVAEGPTFDLTVRDVHEYLVHNAVTHNSGGKTRRAAKMVILNADHPDVEEFIWCKAVEERKARALRDAGFDMDLDGKDSHSIQYQNANNSVRVTDEFMQAVIDDRDWDLEAVVSGETVKPIKARDLMRQIAQAAWECADPGMQYDTTINRWHTAPNTGRINASNPCCFVGDTLVETADGPVRFDLLEKMAAAGDDLPAVLAFDLGRGEMSWRPAIHAWVAGRTRRLVEVRTEGGLRLQCTPEHRFLTPAGDYVEARQLGSGDALRASRDGDGSDDRVVSVAVVDLHEPVTVYDLEVEGTHNFAVSSESHAEHSVIVHNSEYMHLDNSACNLASINLLKYLDEDGTFDTEGFEHTVEVIFTAQEILVGNADYPTEKIAETSREFRQLGLGYANLGALLMAEGLPYDSSEGRAWASAITALMTGRAYATSARTAGRMGPFAGYAKNADAMLNVLRMHRAETAKIDEERVPPELLSAAQRSWDEAVELGELHGVRNSQSSVLAPTGTIGLMLDCDTTGIEPDLALTKAKKLVGGGTMFIVNQTVPRALRKLGYDEQQIDEIVGYVDEHKTIVGAPHLDPEHLSVFACSMGDNTIHYMGHVNMMAAAQPFISGAISKTANVPEETTVEEIEQLYIDSWKLGLKAVAIYRDNCKVAQPLATQIREGASIEPSNGEAVLADAAKQVERVVETVIIQEPVRQKLSRKRPAKTFSFRVADCHGYVTVGEFEDGRPGEIFLRVAKQGSTLAGIMDAFAISVSHGLQYGVPLEAFVDMFINLRFEPAGMTDDPDIRFATSLVDYIFRRLAVEYLPAEKRAELGVLTVGERLQPTLPGVEEATATKEPGTDPQLTLDPPAASGVEPVQSTPPAESASEPPGPAAFVGPTGETVICHVCGDIMQRAGSCFACPSCGATSGCS